jgi:RsiW-degrading membrane proteinase PrsW (M82 family)
MAAHEGRTDGSPALSGSGGAREVVLARSPEAGLAPSPGRQLTEPVLIGPAGNAALPSHALARRVGRPFRLGGARLRASAGADEESGVLDGSLVLMAILGAAAAWVVYLRWKDRRRPEPLAVMLATVGGGGLAVGAAFGAYRVFDWLGAEATWGALAGPLPTAVGIAALIGVAEEGAKLLPVWAFARFSRHFDELLDGGVYAGASAIGFAAAETATMIWVGEGLSLQLLARAVAAPISHVLFAVPAGLGLAAFMLRGRRGLFVLGAGVSVTAHGSYDLLLARGLPGAQASAAVLVLVLWLAFLETARRLEPDPARAGS